MFKKGKTAAGRRKNKYFLIIIGFILLSGIFLFIFLATRNFLHISFLDVGQGDAILIRTPGNKNILIDGGPDNLVLHSLGEALPFYIHRFDYLIVSHFHDDHIIGLVEVLRRYQVDRIILGPSKISSPVASALLLEIKKLNIPIINIENSGRLQLNDDCILFFINPESLNVKDNENNSLVVKLDCDNNKFLFAGDNELEAEAALIKSDFDLSADIFKASHHGSKTSNSDSFLEVVSPKKMIISVGKDNRFSHPNQEVLNRAGNMRIEVLRTDVDGTINILAEIK